MAKLFTVDSWKKIIYVLLATLITFFSFFTNIWKVADEKWFQTQNYDMESFIVGRLVESDTNGVYSYGGLTGVGATGSQDGTPYQYTAFLNRIPFDAYETYDSQIGGQGILFSLLDRKVDHYFYPSPQVKLDLYHAITSLLSAFMIGLIVLWFYLEFGFITSLFVLISANLSPWLIVFSDKIWWSMWAFYVPMVVVMYSLRNKNLSSYRHILLGLVVFITVLAKCVFNGYEYITTTLIMMMVPFIYYCIKWRIRLRTFIVGLITGVGSSCLAILISFAILCVQISSVTGSYQNGIDHIVSSLQKRTYADSEKFPSNYSASLKSDSVSVVITYLKGSYFGPEKYLPTTNPFIKWILPHINYMNLILLFGIGSILLYYLRKRNQAKEGERTSLSLISATWFSLLAPLSWFIVFKAHSYIHTHMNFIVWQMPFTFFGFAVFGFLIQTLLVKRRLPVQVK